MRETLARVMTRRYSCVMTPNENHTPRRTVRVDDALWNSAQEMAEKKRLTISDVVRAGLERFVADDHLDLRSTRRVILDTLEDQANDILGLRAAYDENGPLDARAIYLDHPLWGLGDQGLAIIEAYLRIEINERREQWGWPADPDNIMTYDEDDES